MLLRTGCRVPGAHVAQTLSLSNVASPATYSPGGHIDTRSHTVSDDGALRVDAAHLTASSPAFTASPSLPPFTSTLETATAASPFGVAYALESLSQLMEQGTVKCSSLAVTDTPRFVHRGLMIGRFSSRRPISVRLIALCTIVDTGRRFYPVAFVKSIVDGLAMSRMNVLHFHLSEECFRVESQKFPQLTAPGSCTKGKYNNTAFYTRADIADIVEFARLRGVRVLPEFDMLQNS